MLARLPADKFVMRQNGDRVHYVYADPLVCGCLYVGTQQAYNQYKANELAQHLADEQQLTRGPTPMRGALDAWVVGRTQDLPTGRGVGDVNNARTWAHGSVEAEPWAWVWQDQGLSASVDRRIVWPNSAGTRTHCVPLH